MPGAHLRGRRRRPIVVVLIALAALAVGFAVGLGVTSLLMAR